MSLFTSFGGKLGYRDILQVDGAHYSSHVKYGKRRYSMGKEPKQSSIRPRKEGCNQKGIPETTANVMDCTMGQIEI